MQKEAIVARIKSMLVEDLFVADSVEVIADDAELDRDLGLDSVGFVELGTLVSEIFNVKVNDTDFGEGHFATVAKLTEFVMSRQSGTIGASV